MLPCIEDDLSIIFSTTDFAETARYTPSGQPVREVSVIFDNGDIAVDDDGYAGRIIKETKVTGRSSDFPNVAQGDTIEVRGVTYYVGPIMNQITGVIEIHLSQDDI